MLKRNFCHSSEGWGYPPGHPEKQQKTQWIPAFAGMTLAQLVILIKKNYFH